MKLRTVVVAALILTVAAVAGLAAFTLAEEARGEASQTTIDAEDELAVEPDIRQLLQSESDHTPTAYGDDVTVTFDGEEWTEGEEYEYYPEDGEIEFLVDEDDAATVAFTYEIPEDQVADEQLTTLTEAYGNIGYAAVGVSFVVLFLFIAGFAARRLRVSNSGPSRGR